MKKILGTAVVILMGLLTLAGCQMPSSLGGNLNCKSGNGQTNCSGNYGQSPGSGKKDTLPVDNNG